MKRIYYNLIFIFAALITVSNTLYANDSIPEHDTFSIHSTAVGEDRTINVWIPEDYKTNAKPLPVMYMADGGIEEDFPHVANTLDELIKLKKIKPMILVGIENTQRRRDLTGFTEVDEDKTIAPIVGGSDKFRAFIKDELFPEINNRYKTTNERSIIGESLSGLFVVETFLTTPDMFDNYIAFDPSLWWNNRHLVQTAKEYLDQFPSTEKRIWFASSNTWNVLYTESLADILKAENRSSITWNYIHAPKEDHSTIFRATEREAIAWIFK